MVVELKNDVEVTGIISEADRAMNLILSDTKHVFPNGTVSHSESASISGMSIRYVHFPHHIKPRPHLNEYIKKIDRIKGHSNPHAIVNRAKRIDSGIASSSGSSSNSSLRIGNEHANTNTNSTSAEMGGSLGAPSEMSNGSSTYGNIRGYGEIVMPEKEEGEC